MSVVRHATAENDAARHESALARFPSSPHLFAELLLKLWRELNLLLPIVKPLDQERFDIVINHLFLGAGSQNVLRILLDAFITAFGCAGRTLRLSSSYLDTALAGTEQDLAAWLVGVVRQFVPTYERDDVPADLATPPESV